MDEIAGAMFILSCIVSVMALGCILFYVGGSAKLSAFGRALCIVIAISIQIFLVMVMLLGWRISGQITEEDFRYTVWVECMLPMKTVISEIRHDLAEQNDEEIEQLLNALDTSFSGGPYRLPKLNEGPVWMAVSNSEYRIIGPNNRLQTTGYPPSSEP